MADELSEQVLAAEQDERRRIALFLHDGPVQALSGIALMLDAALEFVQRGDKDQALEVMEKAMTRTRATIGELRDLSFNIEPVVLRDQGFGTAVHALAQNRALEHGIHVDLDVEAADALGEQAQAALYQIVREALEGAIRRGPPTKFSVHVSKGDGTTLDVEIHDDAPGERRKRSVEVLEERARSLDASLSVETADDGSTMRLQLRTG